MRFYAGAGRLLCVGWRARGWGDCSPKFFAQYKKLRGKKDKDGYLKALDIFFRETQKAFVWGEGDKESALAAFRRSADVDEDEASRIFRSVDEVHAYS